MALECISVALLDRSLTRTNARVSCESVQSLTSSRLAQSFRALTSNQLNTDEKNNHNSDGPRESDNCACRNADLLELQGAATWYPVCVEKTLPRRDT